ncbi:GNAT family N-acetyltransferase [Primorskyibacter marinus]|uniref:GNAT family N-acetyltransferase n=1 Tax=Primorskyibacter marinus TaxID=1977320 RepID=UPI000E3083AC|nr:GNAT family N-acetyltransferase [Primorskyibacter marinus]
MQRQAPSGPMYEFRPVTRADYDMLRGWLGQAHVAPVWGPPEHEIALIDADIDGGDCQMHVVSQDGVAFAFIQDWCPHLAGVPHFTDTVPRTRAVDTFLGVPSFLGQCHAKAYVRQYAQTLLDGGAAEVVTDPRLTNPRGIAIFRGAGFIPGEVRPCEDGELVQNMHFRRS